ncbi:MAG: ABC transporter permease subunit [Promethearchaeota archaeon]
MTTRAPNEGSATKALATRRRASAAEKGREKKGMGSSLAFYLLLGLVGLACVLPVAWTYVLAVKADRYTGESGAPVPDQVPDDPDSFLPENWFNFENFEHVLFETDFFTYLRNSVVVALGTAVLGVVVSLTAAYAFSRFRFRGRSLFLDSVLVTQMFPNILVVLPLFLVWAQLGLLNSTLGLVLVYLSISIPFCTWMLKGYFDAIPVDLEEAAMTLGLSRVGAFYRVVLPAVRPGIIATALYTFITAYNEYMVALTFNVLPESQTLPVAINQFFPPYQVPQYTYLAAFGILVSIPVVLLFFALQRHLQGGALTGAVK